jgi:hypothetical protein
VKRQLPSDRFWPIFDGRSELATRDRTVPNALESGRYAEDRAKVLLSGD